jgi:hypothetical protein
MDGTHSNYSIRSMGDVPDLLFQPHQSEVGGSKRQPGSGKKDIKVPHASSLVDNEEPSDAMLAKVNLRPLMKIFFLLPFCFSILSLSAALADQVVMKNGDRVTGSIVKKDGKNLTIKTEQFGLVTASWDQVDSVKVDTPVTVVLQDGKSLQATLATSDGKVQVTANGTSQSVAPSDITTIRNGDEETAYERLQHPGLGQLWVGTGTLGLAGTAGNARTSTFTAGVTAARVTNTDKTSIYFNIIKASSFANGTNSETAEAVRGGWAYDHNLTTRLFFDTFNDWEYDKFQNLDLRYTIGGGPGFHVIKSTRSLLDVLAGADFDHARFNTPLTTKTGEFYFGDSYTLKLNAITSLSQTFRMFNDFSDASNYRANFDVSANTKIGRWLNWNVSLSDRYLNHPAAGRKTNDFLYTTGIGVTFAR